MKNRNTDKIRINLLLPADKARFEKNKKKIFFFALFAGFLFFIFILDFSAYYENHSKKLRILSLRQQFMMDKNKNIINSALISAIDDKRKLKNSIEKKIAVISSLKKLKINWNAKISSMINASPKGVWLSGFLLRNSIIEIRGNSLSLREISLYIERLKKTRIFKKLILTNADRKIINGNAFYSFKLNAYLPSYKNAAGKVAKE